jgi:hypothetical protein
MLSEAAGAVQRILSVDIAQPVEEKTCPAIPTDCHSRAFR